MHIKQIQHSVGSTVEDEKVKVVKMDRNQTDKSTVRPCDTLSSVLLKHSVPQNSAPQG